MLKFETFVLKLNKIEIDLQIWVRFLATWVYLPGVYYISVIPIPWHWHYIVVMQLWKLKLN